MSQFTLRPYQQDAVTATVKYFRKNTTPAVIVLPTGAGKSLVIAQLAAIANHRVLVLTHVKELVEQNQKKFETYGLDSSIFSAGLKQKDSSAKVVFASVQSAVRNLDYFSEPYSLLIIDECHRLNDDEDSQYGKVIKQLQQSNSGLKVLGLTATPYRLESGWIYQYHYRGFYRTERKTPFKDCIYELPLSFMIKHQYLTPPQRYDAAIAEYDFSQLPGFNTASYSTGDLNHLLSNYKRVTRSIINQVIKLSESRFGVMIFAATVKHAREVLSYLPEESSALIIGDTDNDTRDHLIQKFKQKQIKFLVNVSVLTTGFDAPHVDVIALLRPTQSVSLFQQIVGRGLRLAENKKDCLVLDYTGSQFNLFHPEVGEVKPNTDSQPVQVFCPECEFANVFWGKCDEQGNIIEHYGRRCQGSVEGKKQQNLPLDEAINIEQNDLGRQRCTFRFRFKNCPHCNEENDIAARDCQQCQQALVDPDDQLKKALQLKDAKVIRCAGITMAEHKNKLKITYHDEQGETLTEYFDLAKKNQLTLFTGLFSRRLLPQFQGSIPNTLSEVLTIASHYPYPDFVIARKNGHFWNVVERVFDYQGKYRRANQL